VFWCNASMALCCDTGLEPGLRRLMAWRNRSAGFRELDRDGFGGGGGGNAAETAIGEPTGNVEAWIAVRSKPEGGGALPGEIEVAALPGTGPWEWSVPGDAELGDVVGSAEYGGGGDTMGSVYDERRFLPASTGLEPTIRSHQSRCICDGPRRVLGMQWRECRVRRGPLLRIVRCCCPVASRAASCHGWRGDAAVRGEGRAQRGRGERCHAIVCRDGGWVAVGAATAGEDGGMQRRRLRRVGTTQRRVGRGHDMGMLLLALDIGGI
jgi:hypothetical protein